MQKQADETGIRETDRIPEKFYMVMLGNGIGFMCTGIDHMEDAPYIILRNAVRWTPTMLTGGEGNHGFIASPLIGDLNLPFTFYLYKESSLYLGYQEIPLNSPWIEEYHNAVSHYNVKQIERRWNSNQSKARTAGN